LFCILKHEPPINAIRGFIVKSAFRIPTYTPTVDIAVDEPDRYVFP
jgi:hypothetical protein